MSQQNTPTLNQRQVRMKLLLAFLCQTLIVKTSYSCPLDAAKEIETVNLDYSCINIRTEDNKQYAGRPPILLLHGLFMFKEVWNGMYQLLALRTGRRVCIADLRNHGDSPWSNKSDISDMAADLNPLLERMKTDQVVLLGHSLGGKIAMHFALTHPEKIDKLIIEDMRPNGITGTAMLLIGGAIDILKGAISAIPKGATEKEAKIAAIQYIKTALKSFNASLELDERAAEYFPIRCSKGKCEWKTNIQLIEKFYDDFEKHLTQSSGQCKKPALFFYGKKSPFKVYEVKEEIKKLFPNAMIMGFENASHTINTFPEYKNAVIKFINS